MSPGYDVTASCKQCSHTFENLLEIPRSKNVCEAKTIIALLTFNKSNLGICTVTVKSKSSEDVVYQKNDENVMEGKKSNELVLKEAYLEQSLITIIRRRQQELFGHICRHKGLEL
ncbi:hypothetical protein PoB_006464500 [Plakobranchus ocellatus]|uniref:Uncharacterized protein n=1 Tax=Plakobranchus ocellatus TaxID=259542 RepID=A0AAV4D227_9GAST|nr:hypothetical protein PoB_006464500 [Plakobranchus ocellatus]